jgi:hypothetical protein
VITDSPQEIVTGQAMLHFIAQGSTDDFHLHNKFHITITPSGEVTAVQIEVGDVVCTGRVSRRPPGARSVLVRVQCVAAVAVSRPHVDGLPSTTMP